MTQIGKLEFDLTDPDAEQAFKIAQAGHLLSHFVRELLQELRAEIKYGNSNIDSADKDRPPTLEELRTWIYKELDERGLTEIVEG